MRKTCVLMIGLAVACVILAAPARAAGTWTWPVVGPVIRPFDPPDSPYGSGHRGIDIAAPIGTPVRAAATGIVSFAGSVGGNLFVTVDHGAGLLSTYGWLSARSVSKDQVVRQGEVIASSGLGDRDVPPTHLHFGVRLNGMYVDPLEYLAPASVVGLIRLAPIDSAA